eukprot:sb/3470395/
MGTLYRVVGGVILINFSTMIITLWISRESGLNIYTQHNDNQEDIFHSDSLMSTYLGFYILIFIYFLCAATCMVQSVWFLIKKGSSESEGQRRRSVKVVVALGIGLSFLQIAYTSKILYNTDILTNADKGIFQFVIYCFAPVANSAYNCLVQFVTNKAIRKAMSDAVCLGYKKITRRASPVTSPAVVVYKSRQAATRTESDVAITSG